MSRALIKRVYFTALSAFGAKQLAMAKLRRPGTVVVLNLHRVSPHRSDYWPPLHPSIFEELLRFLQSDFEVCRISELASVESKQRPIAVLSFDDGYRDFLEYGLPLLDKYRMPVNMNIIPSCVISGEPIWNVQIYDFLHAAPLRLVNELEIPGFSRKLADATPRSKMRFGLSLSRHLKERPRSEREAIWQSIEPHMRSLQQVKTRMMSETEILSIAHRVEIGAHSYSHESMGYEDKDFFEEDFRNCKEFFEDRLAMPLSIYAFPNGSYREEQIEFLRQNAVKQILLVGEKFADPGSDLLTRITIYGDDGRQVRLRALGY